MYQAPNAPESIGGVLDTGFKLYPPALGKVFGLAVVGSLGSSLPSTLSAALLEDGAVAGAVMLFIAVLVVGVAAALVCMGAVIARIDAIAVGRPMMLSESLRVGVRRAPALLGSIVLYALATVVGLVLFIVPGVLAGVWFAFAALAVVVDGKGPIESLGYSTSVTRGHWWRTFVLLGVAFAVLWVVYSVVVTIALVVAILVSASTASIEAFAQNPPWYLDVVIGPLVAGIATPLVYALWLAIYYDLRLRREGTDLAERIDAAAPPAAASA